MLYFKPFFIAISLISITANGEVRVERISVSSSNAEGNSISEPGSVTNDGRFVSFTSGSFNLVPDDFNDGLDFSYSILRDREIETNSWVLEPAVRSRPILYPILTPDGRFIVFLTGQTNLIPGDTSLPDFFRKDLYTNTIERVNQPPSGGNSNGSGEESAAISADGRFIAFTTTANDLVNGDMDNLPDVFVRDMSSNFIEQISVSSEGTSTLDGVAFYPDISGDGRYIVFSSSSSQLGLPAGSPPNVFIRDRLNRTTTRVSLGVGGEEPNGSSGFGYLRAAVSDDGRWVLFGSEASNLVLNDTNDKSDLFLADQENETISRISLNANNEQIDMSVGFSSMSADGSRITYTIIEQSDHLLMLFDRSLGLRVVLNRGDDNQIYGRALQQKLSANGQFLIIRGNDEILRENGDDNDDVFLFDLRNVIQIFSNGFEAGIGN